jgi:hypothetical protein
VLELKEALAMTATTAPQLEELSPSTIPAPPARQATVDMDQLGISVSAELRLTGATTEVRDLFSSTPPDEHVTIIENGLLIGLLTVATARDVEASDAARLKLAAAAERLGEVADRIGSDHDHRSTRLEKCVTSLVADTRQAIKDGRAEEQRVREELALRAEALTKAARAMDTTRAELEKRTNTAFSQMATAQTEAKEAMLKGTEATLRKLIDHTDPTSAPSLIKGVVEKAAVDMRATTAQNVAELEGKLNALLGEGSPFAERIAVLARDGAARDVKQVEELLDKLRQEVIVTRLREEHDPNIKGDSYEEDVLQLLEQAAGVYGMTATRTGTEVGEAVDSKKGDHLLLDECSTPVAAIEARARKGVGQRALLEGMQSTAVNRDVKIVAYFVRSDAELPTGLGEFSRGRMPMIYKRLPDELHALIAVIDPTSPSVPERLAVLLWVIHRLQEEVTSSGGEVDAGQRINEALPCLSQLEARLGAFRTVKSGLTKASGQINQVRGKVVELEGLLQGDVARIEDILAGG